MTNSSAASVAYADWITDHATDTYGCCAELTQQMAEAFPELTRVRGHYYCTAWGRRAHWWLATPGGEIVDPSANQFPSRGHGHYAPWDETRPEPTGMCPNCGGEVYDGGTCCSAACTRKYAAYCLHGTR